MDSRPDPIDIERVLREEVDPEDGEISDADMADTVKMYLDMEAFWPEMNAAIARSNAARANAVPDPTEQLGQSVPQSVDMPGSSGEARRRSDELSDADESMELKMFKVRPLGPMEPITAVSLEGDFLATGGSDTTVRLWDVKTGREIHRYVGHTDTVTGVKLLDKEDSERFGLAVSICRETEEHGEDGAEANAMLHAARVRNTNTIISVSLDCHIRIWNTSSGNCMKDIYTMNPLRSIEYLTNYEHNRSQFISGSGGGKVEVRSLPEEGTYFFAQAGDCAILSIKIQDRCGRLFCLAADGVVHIFELEWMALKPITKSPAPSGENLTGEMRFSSLYLHEQTAYFGLDGPDVASFNRTTNTLRMIRNHPRPLEVGYTNAVTGHNDLLFASGCDEQIPRGYLNLLQLPEESYLGTLLDPEEMCRIRCVDATTDSTGKLVLVTASVEKLTLWYQDNTRKSKKKDKDNSNRKDGKDGGAAKDDDDDDSDNAEILRKVEVVMLPGYDNPIEESIAACASVSGS